MSSEANLERKRYNLMRLKQQQASKKAEEEQRARSESTNSNEFDFDLDEYVKTNGVKKKSSERLICRSQSSTSNTSNLDLDIDFDLDVEEGSWYDVFRDEPSPSSELDSQLPPPPSQQIKATPKGNKSRSPCPDITLTTSKDNSKHIARMRRRLSVSSDPPSPIPSSIKSSRTASPISFKPQSIPVNPLQNKDKQNSFPRRQNNNSSEPEKPPSIIDKIITSAGQYSPKATPSQSVNLVALHENINGNVTPNGRRPSSDSFKDLRSSIDDQLFNNH